MRITADTHVLVRALVQDDPEQAKAAVDLLESAEWIAIPVPVLCELVWVLRRVYGFSASDCATSIAARAGLKLLSAGGDFADGVIAYGGRALGGEQLATFDREVARLLSTAGEPVLLL